jgi:crotonobetainyl-CoA:carnitine CoA-transferase CaiB-like acyl-CoA transferase
MNGVEPPRMGNRHPEFAPHGVFRSAGNDRWVSIAVRTEEEWKSLCRAIGAPGLASDARFATLPDRKRNEDALEETLSAWTRERSPEEATALLQAAGVAAFPSMTNEDIAKDPHLNERGFFVDLPHPEVGARHHAGIPWKFSATPCAVERPAPRLGEHTDEVLRDVLGYSADEIERLKADGALG